MLTTPSSDPTMTAEGASSEIDRLGGGAPPPPVPPVPPLPPAPTALFDEPAPLQLDNIEARNVRQMMLDTTHTGFIAGNSTPKLSQMKTPKRTYMGPSPAPRSEIHSVQLRFDSLVLFKCFLVGRTLRFQRQGSALCLCRLIRLPSLEINRGESVQIAWIVGFQVDCLFC